MSREAGSLAIQLHNLHLYLEYISIFFSDFHNCPSEISIFLGLNPLIIEPNSSADVNRFHGAATSINSQYFISV